MLNKKITILILLIALAFGMQTSVSFAGFLFFNESTSDILASYFDLRNRDTQVQVTNTSSTLSVTLHVQIFSDAFNCVDRDFTDTLTPNETHVYDIRNLVSANGNPINFQIPDNSHGFVIISAGTGGPGGEPRAVVIGNFRITDVVGYEYRVNSAACCSELEATNIAKFTDNWGASLSDIVGVEIDSNAAPAMGVLPDGTRDLTVEITDGLELFMFNDEETAISCGQVQFGCDESPGDGDGDGGFSEFTGAFINQGINEIFPNSRGADPICSGDLNTDGYIEIRGINFDEFVGYIGLNDGAGIGSMDRFKAIDGQEIPTQP